MKIYSFYLIILLSFATNSWAENARFDNYRLYNINIENTNQLDWLKKLEVFPDGYIFWNTVHTVGSTLKIVVPPHKFADFSDLVKNLEISVTLQSNNLQNDIDFEKSSFDSRSEFGWTTYHKLEEINEWLMEKVAQYPNILTSYDIGRSYEGRVIKAVKLSKREGNPIVFIEANIHAREWITSATATWILNELLSSSDEQILTLTETLDWVFIPVVNVDGYEYTLTNRMWRKTRQPHSPLCYGADPNRNFDYQWMTVGASTNPCSDTFAGPEAFSEPETAALRDFFNSMKDDIGLFLSFHSYGQYILIPFGWSADAPIENYVDLHEIGDIVKSAIAERYGTQYTAGNSAAALYAVGGSSDDWAIVNGAKLSYTFEFRDTGATGFILPASQIVENSQEILDGVVALVAGARSRGFLL